MQIICVHLVANQKNDVMKVYSILSSTTCNVNVGHNFVIFGMFSDMVVH